MTRTLMIDGTPVVGVPVGPTHAMLSAGLRQREGHFNGVDPVFKAMLSAADPALTEALVEMREALEAMREHAIKNATQWEIDAGSHHHPIWSRVASILGRVTTGEASDAV